MTALSDKTARELANKTLMNLKGVVISTTNAKTGLNGAAIQVLADASISHIVYSKDSKSDDLPATLVAGLVIYLTNITEITLASGAVIVYQP